MRHKLASLKTIIRLPADIKFLAQKTSTLGDNMSNIDTLRRQWLIISLLKDHARYLKSAVSTTQIYDYLSRRDVQVTRRMVQRDMLILEKAVNSIRRRKGNPAGWTYIERAEGDDEFY